VAQLDSAAGFEEPFSDAASLAAGGARSLQSVKAFMEKDEET